MVHLLNLISVMYCFFPFLPTNHSQVHGGTLSKSDCARSQQPSSPPPPPDFEALPDLPLSPRSSPTITTPAEGGALRSGDVFSAVLLGTFSGVSVFYIPSCDHGGHGVLLLLLLRLGHPHGLLLLHGCCCCGGGHSCILVDFFTFFLFLPPPFKSLSWVLFAPFLCCTLREWVSDVVPISLFFLVFSASGFSRIAPSVFIRIRSLGIK